MYKILELIELDKDYFIKKSTDTKEKKIKITRGENPFLKRFNLIPICNCTKIPTMLSTLFNKTVTSTNFKTTSKTENCCFIILYSVINTPLEYDIKPLILKYAGVPFIQPETYGINEKIIKRFETIKYVESNDFKSNKKWNFTYEVVGDYLNTSNTYIIETLDGDNFRILSPTLFGRNYSIPKDKVEKIIKFLEHPCEISRISCYHKLLIKKATANMFIGKPLDFETMENNAKDNNMQIIKNELFLKLYGLIQEIIKKDFSSGVKIKSSSEINEIIHDDRIGELFSSILLKMYEVGFNADNPTNFNAGKFAFSELLSSFIVDLQDSTRKFMKDLHDGYNSNLLPSEVFTSKDLPVINKKIEFLLLNSLENQLNSSDNIYSSLNYKYLILNYNSL